MHVSLTLDDLSRFTGEPPERLQEWRRRELLSGSEGEDFVREDIERVRLVAMCLRRGIALDDITEASQRDGVIQRYVDMVSEASTGRWYSLAEAAEAIDLNVDTVRRLWDATGFTADQGEMLTDEDIEALAVFKRLMDTGFPENALVEGGRVYADSLARVAEMESKLFHFYIHKRLQAEGISEQELLRRVETAGDAARPLIEPTLLYFHRKSWQRSIREDWVMHVAEEVGLIKTGDVPGQLQSAVVFIDLSSFTPLAEAMGDATAADVLDRFSIIVRRSVGAFDGRVVKQIGDAFMLVFQSARVRGCLRPGDRHGSREGAAVSGDPRRHPVGRPPLPRGRLRRLQRQHRRPPRLRGRPPPGARHRRRAPRGSEHFRRRIWEARKAHTEGARWPLRAVRGAFDHRGRG